jgi:hypothetical protein
VASSAYFLIFCAYTFCMLWDSGTAISIKSTSFFLSHSRISDLFAETLISVLTSLSQ